MYFQEYEKLWDFTVMLGFYDEVHTELYAENYSFSIFYDANALIVSNGDTTASLHVADEMCYGSANLCKSAAAYLKEYITSNYVRDDNLLIESMWILHTNREMVPDVLLAGLCDVARYKFGMSDEIYVREIKLTGSKVITYRSINDTSTVYLPYSGGAYVLDSKKSTKSANMRKELLSRMESGKGCYSILHGSK